MGRRIDASLALLTLAGFVGALLAVEASFSPSFFVLGGLGTLGFEVLASRDTERVRAFWARPLVQLFALVLAFGVVVAGTITAPSQVLSAGIGALVAYLCLLGLLTVHRCRV